MSKFNKGDKVIYTGSTTPDLIGKTGVIRGISLNEKNNIHYYVTWDSNWGDDRYCPNPAEVNLTALPVQLEIFNDSK